MRAPTELLSVVRDRALSVSSVTPIKVEFPLAGFYRAVHITTNTILTVGTGTTPISEGELSITKGLSLYDNYQQYMSNIPGRGLYRLQSTANGASLAQKTAIAASNGTYDANYHFYFANPFQIRPDDSAVYMGKKSSMTLEISFGSVADLLTTVGTATIAPTIDVTVERWIDEDFQRSEKRPTLYRELKTTNINPANQTFMDVERADDQLISNILLASTNSATAGVGFSGTLANTIISTVDYQTTVKNFYNQIKWSQLCAINKRWYGWETLATGFANIDFSRGGSILECLPSGKISQNRVSWVNGTLSTSMVSMIVDSYRAIRG